LIKAHAIRGGKCDEKYPYYAPSNNISGNWDITQKNCTSLSQPIFYALDAVNEK